MTSENTSVATTLYPTAVTVQLAGPSALPPAASVNAVDDQNCARLYALVARMPLGPYIPSIAKALSPRVGCEINFGLPRATNAIFSDDAFALGWVSDDSQVHRGPTGDPDETRTLLSSGHIAFVDLTGNDGAGYGAVCFVAVPRQDGSVAYVHGFTGGSSQQVTLTIADELDTLLNNS